VAGGPSVDAAGRYHSRGTFSALTVGVYVFVILLLLVVVIRTPYLLNADALYGLIVICLFFLARYASTSYRIDDSYLYARRLVGSRRIPLSEIRKIEAMRLRDLSPTGFFGSWGYRGRMWSPFVGKLDAIYTDPAGLLVTPDDIPLFISPRDPTDFARELSRRVRSYTGPLGVDVGAA
jgi:hypothetical protein